MPEFKPDEIMFDQPFKGTIIPRDKIVFDPPASQQDLETAVMAGAPEAALVRASQPEKPIVLEPQDILTANKHLNFVQRIINTEKSPIIQNPDGSISTHKMASAELDGKYIAYPTIIQESLIKPLKELSPNEAYDYAVKSKQYIEFPTQSKAMDFARGSWKQMRGSPTKLSGTPDATSETLAQFVKQPLIEPGTLSEIGGAAKDMIFGDPRSVMIPEERYQQVAKEAGVDVHPGWSKPWEMIGSQIGAGAKMSAGGLVDLYEKLTGPPATDIQKGWMDSIKKMFTVPPEKVGTDLASKVLQGFGSAPAGIAEFGGAMAIGGIPGAMALGAIKTPGGVIEKGVGAVELGLLGAGLRATGGLSLAPRVGAMGAIGGGQAAFAGGDAKDITAGALVMMVLATPGGRKLKEAVDTDTKPADMGKAEWENVKEAVNRAPEPTIEEKLARIDEEAAIKKAELTKQVKERGAEIIDEIRGKVPTPEPPLKTPEPAVAAGKPEVGVTAPQKTFRRSEEVQTAIDDIETKYVEEAKSKGKKVEDGLRESEKDQELKHLYEIRDSFDKKDMEITNDYLMDEFKRIGIDEKEATNILKTIYYWDPKKDTGVAFAAQDTKQSALDRKTILEKLWNRWLMEPNPKHNYAENYLLLGDLSPLTPKGKGELIKELADKSRKIERTMYRILHGEAEPDATQLALPPPSPEPPLKPPEPAVAAGKPEVGVTAPVSAETSQLTGKGRQPVELSDKELADLYRLEDKKADRYQDLTDKENNRLIKLRERVNLIESQKSKIALEDGYKTSLAEVQQGHNRLRYSVVEYGKSLNKPIDDVANDLRKAGIPEDDVIGAIKIVYGREPISPVTETFGRGVLPAEAPAKAGAKEAWEMTREEWDDAIWDNRKLRANYPEIPQNQWDAMKTETKRLEYGAEAKPIDERGTSQVIHRSVIEKAIKEAKPVPPEVLVDYPDLAAKGKGEVDKGITDKTNFIIRAQTYLQQKGKGFGYLGEMINKPNEIRLIDGEVNVKNKGRWVRVPEETLIKWDKEIEPTPTTKMFGGGPDTWPWIQKALGKESKIVPKEKDAELSAAQAKVSSRISREEYEKKPRITPSNIYTSLVDRLHPLKKLMESYPRGKTLVGRDPYIQTRLFEGWHGKAEAFLEHHPFDRKTYEFETGIKPLRDIIKPLEEKGGLHDFSDYLVARRAIERESRGFKTGVNMEAAQTVINKLAPTFENSAKEFSTYMDSLLRYMRDSEMISPERYKQIKDGSTDYAPLLRLFEPEKTQGGGKGYEARQILKAFKGSERKIIDPIESAIRLTYVMINAAERNNVGLSLIKWAKESGAIGNEINKISPKMVPTEVGLREILKDPEARELLKEHGFTEEEAAIFRPSAFRPAENVISVWENGKRQFYETPKDIADIIRGMDQQTANMWLRIFSGPAQALRLGATTLSPEFGLRNFLKDQFPAFIHSKYGYKPFIDYFRGVAELASGGKDFWNYMISGAPHAELVSLDRRLLQKKLIDITSGKLTMPGFLVRHPIEAMKILSEYSERGTRLGEFKKGLEQEAISKEAIQEAGFQAREVTVDFGRRGAGTKGLNMLVAFWNASMQGLDKVVRAHRTNPLGTMAKAAVAITVPAVLLEIAYHDDERYKNLPWWRKDLFFNIPSPVGVISLPKPWTYGLLYGSIPQRITNYILNQDSKAFDKLLIAIGREFPDVPIPTIAKSFIEAWANKSFFFDRPIVPRWKEKLPSKYQYGEWTSETSKQIGNMISKIPVISDSKAASPAVIDNFVLSWTGGAGRIALNALDLGARKVGLTHDIPKPKRVLADYPIVRAFVSRYPSADAEPIKKFYENADKIQAANQALKQEGGRLSLQKRKTELNALVKELGADAFLNIQSIRTSIGNAHRFIDVVHSHPDMSPEDKRKAIEKTYLSIISVTDKVNKQVEEARQQYKRRGATTTSSKAID